MLSAGLPKVLPVSPNCKICVEIPTLFSHWGTICSMQRLFPLHCFTHTRVRRQLSDNISVSAPRSDETSSVLLANFSAEGAWCNHRHDHSTSTSPVYGLWRQPVEHVKWSDSLKIMFYDKRPNMRKYDKICIVLAYEQYQGVLLIKCARIGPVGHGTTCRPVASSEG